MSKYEVSPEELTALSSAYQEVAANIEADLHALTIRTAPLREGWIGSKSISFQVAANDIESSRRELHAALERMANLLRQAGEAYHSVEENVRNAFDV